MRRYLSFILGGLAVVVILVGGGLAVTVALRTYTTAPVAPTVPQIRPQAAESPVATGTCSLSFTIAAPPVPVCNSDCSNDAGCPTNTNCINGKCRNRSCSDETDCACPEPEPTCNDSCVNSADCPNELACISGHCRNASCSSQADCKCPPPLKTCNESCLIKEECASGMTCAGGHCRNVSCITSETCICPVPVPTPTPTPTPVPPTAVGAQTHHVCNENNACVEVSGAGRNECSSDASCQPVATPPPIPPSGMDMPTMALIIAGLTVIAFAGLLVLF